MPDSLAQSYLVRIEEQSTTIPVLPTERGEYRDSSVSGLGEGEFMLRVGSVTQNFGVKPLGQTPCLSPSAAEAMRISAVPTLLFRPDWLPQEVTALCGVVFPRGDAVHAGVYAKADVWYLQSAPSGIGAVPEQDGYWEVVRE